MSYRTYAVRRTFRVGSETWAEGQRLFLRDDHRLLDPEGVECMIATRERRDIPIRASLIRAILAIGDIVRIYKPRSESAVRRFMKAGG